jgi:hypothetical protein
MLTIGILSILSAIVLSIISAVFSVTGIRTIFSGALLGVTIMGASMEFAKISATLWLYRMWTESKRLLKVYFIIAIVILIAISTIGIFGYLSKAYIGQETVVTQYDNKIERLEKSIEREQREIERAQKNITLLDDALQSYIDIDVITRALDKRDEQEEEREELRNRIEKAENNIANYEDRIYELRNEKEQFEVNVGPVKYIAILLYGESNARDFYDNAARILIIFLCIVFDPFAVLLMVAGNVSIEQYSKTKRRREGKKKELQTKSQKQSKPKREKVEKKPVEIDLPTDFPFVKDYKGDIPGSIQKKRREKVQRK